MKLYYTGFNLYGQFINSNDFIVKSFIDFSYNLCTDVILSHTHAVFKKGNDIYLHGAINGKTHEIRKLNSNDGTVSCISSFDNLILILIDTALYKVDVNKSLKLELIPNFENVENSYEKVSIIDIVCGGNIKVALSKCGKLFNIPNKLTFENENIVQMVAGREHCLILDNSGNVYSFGTGSRGQLGHGSLNNRTEPKLIEALAGIRITKIGAGGWHSCALSESGDLYTWGWNSNGQLGLFTDDQPASVMATPQLVEFEDCNSNFTEIGCGSRHTIALLDSKKLYGMGWNKYKQLGSLSDENIYKLTFLHDFCNEDTIALRCGSWNTSVLIT